MNPVDYLVHHLMLPILTTAHDVLGSYGWAIVLLTVMIKTALLPLTMQSYYSMKEMQKLQPKLKKIQERYRNKPEELNKRMMELYRTHKVNPLGGCLPLLIQMPFLIALYASLIGEDFKKMLAAGGDTSFLFISDLAAMGIQGTNGLHIDNLVMLIVFGATTFLQQKIMTPPGGGDPAAQAMQKQMQIIMPITITAMFLFFPVPSGVFLYLVVSNLLSIAQYAFLNHQSKLKDAKAAADKVAAGMSDDEDEDEPAEEVSETQEKVLAGAASDAKYRVKKGGKKKKRK